MPKTNRFVELGKQNAPSEATKTDPDVAIWVWALHSKRNAGPCGGRNFKSGNDKKWRPLCAGCAGKICAWMKCR